MSDSTVKAGQRDQPIPTGLSLVYLVHAIGGGIFGLAFFFIPHLWGEWVNWGSVDPTITRLYGAGLSSIAVASWLGYRAQDWSAVRILVVFDLALSVLTAMAGLYEVLVAGGPVFTWVIVGIAAFFTVAFSYYYYQLRAGTRSSTSTETAR